MKIQISEKNIKEFIEAMNHRMTNIEGTTGKLQNDVKWMKRIGYYMATLLTAIAAKSLFF